MGKVIIKKKTKKKKKWTKVLYLALSLQGNIEWLFGPGLWI
jgi:hypothetical protein